MFVKTITRILIPCTMLFAAGLSAHDPKKHTSSGNTSDYATAQEHGLTLSLKIVPLAALDAAAGKDLRVAAARYAAAHAKNENLIPRVGEPAYIVAELRRGTELVRDAELSLRLDHVEDNKTVFSTRTARLDDGRWVWGQQFFDGAEHVVDVNATVDGKSLHALLITPVQGISPPGMVIFKSMLMLLGVVALGMALGYILVLRLFG